MRATPLARCSCAVAFVAFVATACGPVANRDDASGAGTDATTDLDATSTMDARTNRRDTGSIDPSALDGDLTVILDENGIEGGPTVCNAVMDLSSPTIDVPTTVPVPMLSGGTAVAGFYVIATSTVFGGTTLPDGGVDRTRTRSGTLLVSGRDVYAVGATAGTSPRAFTYELGMDGARPVLRQLCPARTDPVIGAWQAADNDVRLYFTSENRVETYRLF